jgi:hypothetical protein
MNKIKVVVGGFAVAVMLGAMLPAVAHARHKVDCSKVMDELNSGKKTKEVAKDLGISKSSVRKCARKAKSEGAAAPEAGGAAAPEAGGAMAKPAEGGGAMAPAPAPMASPAAH